MSRFVVLSHHSFIHETVQCSENYSTIILKWKQYLKFTLTLFYNKQSKVCLCGIYVVLVTMKYSMICNHNYLIRVHIHYRVIYYDENYVFSFDPEQQNCCETCSRWTYSDPCQTPRNHQVSSRLVFHPKRDVVRKLLQPPGFHWPR